MDPNWPYLRGYEAFKRVGSDVFLTVSPGKNHLFVADAEVTFQITSQRNRFKKPIEIYKNVDLYGKNVVSTEGTIWRQHRKLTSPSFSETNNELVRVLWPHEEEKEAPSDALASTRPSAGHTMSYRDSISFLMEHVIWVPLLPDWFRPISPWNVHRKTHEAYTEFGKYMAELYEAKKSEISAGKTESDGLDLLGALVKGAGISQQPASTNNADPEKNNPSKGQLLSNSEIIGNAFVFLIAGHETTANALHFSLLHLALNPSFQAPLQKELDDIFGDRPISAWNYEQDFPKLFGGMAGAVINETLRMLPAVISIPKSTQKGEPQALNFDGRQIVVPESCAIGLCGAGVGNNPKYWPSGPDHGSRMPADDLDQFKPARWLVDSSKVASTTNADNDEPDTEEFGGPQGPHSAASLYHPPRGAFIPFSEGPRSCLGRKFAQAELFAALAVIFRFYSVELATDEWEADEAVNAMKKGGPDRRQVWEKAANRATDLLKHGMGSMITLQMRAGRVPLRLVKRGEERFVFG
ncbi:hypothetical protein W97_07425 [Coniosporium apollinis CBS 100218]|uniref:Cytochrome P450 n=1 Tax=Coniosporium apollinis (strain CBS 100218) TaxID=1168221 RepID=R7Z1G0_CONA1|nr:uncharacterized protein W97_07425 [Coniosporium apollinis CBS 100218]EON67928.1 hypothetical protein W97_07425 [Coniosporium apollinis CBS 100218]